MLKRIVLKNFMSHRNSVFELVDGVNVITGPNNSGKSAVVSALQLLADLPVKEGDYMVRHGATQALVTVETAEGDELTWHRKGMSAGLAINGDIDMRLQNNREYYLEKLHRYLRLPKVTSNEGKQDFDIHFATQKSPIFLINEPPSRAALFFASTSDARYLFEVRDRYKEQVKDKKKQLQITKETLERQNQILVSLAPLDEIERLFLVVKQIYKLLPKEQEEYQHACLLLPKLRIAWDLQRRYMSRQGIFRGMTAPPTMWEVDRFDELLRSMLAHQRLAGRLQQQHKALGGLMVPPQLEQEVSLGYFLSQVRAHVRGGCRLRDSARLLARLNPVPEVVDVGLMQTMYMELSRQSRRYAFACRYASLLSQLQVPPTTILLEPWEKVLAHLRKTIKKRERCREKLKLARMVEMPPVCEEVGPLEKLLKELRAQARGVQLQASELQKAKLALQEWVKEHPTCPACGGNLNVELMPEVHCHGSCI